MVTRSCDTTLLLWPGVVESRQSLATYYFPVVVGLNWPTHSEAKSPDLLCCSVWSVGVWEVSVLCCLCNTNIRVHLSASPVITTSAM